jgi:peptidoglycan/xylan/chitin deacetylase (PgdA/CDA1 family)
MGRNEERGLTAKAGAIVVGAALLALGSQPGASATTPAGGTAQPAATANASLQPPAYTPLELPFPKGVISPRLHCLSRGDPTKKYVALTFDDGPKPEYTLELLALLERSRVPATFFYVGSQCKLYPDLVKDTYASGNEIGNHSWHHYRLPTLKPAEKRREIDEAQAIIAGLTGVQPRFFRPPGGHRDTETEELLDQRGMIVAMWDLSLNDADPRTKSADIVRQVEDKIRPGTVILAHSGIPATMEALPQIIHNLTARGYTFVTLSTLANGLAPRCAGQGRGQNGISNACFRTGEKRPVRRKRSHAPAAARPNPAPPAVEATPPPADPAPLIVDPHADQE